MNFYEYFVENVIKLSTADGRDKREHYFLRQMMSQIHTHDNGVEKIDGVEVSCCVKLYPPSMAFKKFFKGQLKQCEQCGTIVHSNCPSSTHFHGNVNVANGIPERYRHSQTLLESFSVKQ